MSIESKINPDGINVADLSLNSPDYLGHPLFDVAGAIDQRKWEEIIELEKSETNVYQKLSDGEAIRIISPEIFERIKMSGEEYQKFYDLHVAKSGFTMGRIKSAAYLKSAYPEKDTVQGLATGDKEEIALWASSGSNRCQYAYFYKLLYPDEHPELMIDDLYQKSTASSLFQYLKRARETNNWESFVYSIMDVKFLFPEIVNALPLNPEDWESMKKHINQMPAQAESTSSSLTRYLAGLKILAAGTAEITKDGVKLTPPKKFAGPVQNRFLPKTKKF